MLLETRSCWLHRRGGLLRIKMKEISSEEDPLLRS